MKKNNKHKLTIVILTLILIGLVAYAIVLIIDKFPSTIPEMSTDGFVPVTVETGDKELVIGANCLAVRGGVSDDLTHSIDNALSKTKDQRPLTHDMTVNILKSYDIKVLMVKITNIKDKNFIGKLFLQSGSKITSIDIRPSDGIGIALRTDAPIYMNETLLKEMGQKIC